jgi:hypothetical protein
VASDSGSAVAQMLYPGAPPRLTPRSWVLAILATLAVISVLSTLGVSMLHTPAMFRDLLPASAEVMSFSLKLPLPSARPEADGTKPWSSGRRRREGRAKMPTFMCMPRGRWDRCSSGRSTCGS